MRELLEVPLGYEAGLWERNGSGGYRVHDWLDHNPPRDQIEDQRRAARERMRRLRSGERSGEVRANVPAKFEGSSATPYPSHNPGPPPDPHQPPPPTPRATGAREPAGWTKKWKRPKGVTAARLEAAVVRCLREIRQVPVVADRAGTAAGEVRRLWTALERPDLDWFADRLVLVARAAQMSGHGLFARDIRAEGSRELVDRTNDVGTLTVQRRWDDRLQAAEEWEASTGRRDGDVVLCRRRRWPERGAPDRWELLEPPAPIVVEYFRVARELLAGEDGAVPAIAVLDELEASGDRSSAAATAIVEAVLAAIGRW